MPTISASMSGTRRLFHTLFLTFFVHRCMATVANPVDYVLPLIGTTNGGHVFPGATLPHGMAKAGLDTDSPGNQAGYDADPQYKAIGFSQMHDSGTGGSASLSNFKIWPFAGCVSFEQCPTSLSARAVYRKTLEDGTPDDFASPGYFASNLSTDIRVELTTTRRTALHRYTFPANASEPRLLVDILDDGMQSGSNPVMNINTTTARVTGSGTFAGSFGPGQYTAYTCVDFKGEGFELGSPTEYGIWTGNTPTKGATNLTGICCGEAGGLLTFNPATSGAATILTRVGVSFISSDQACANAEEEIPDWDFDRVHNDAAAEWNELLGRVQVDTTGVDKETIQLFYSSLYRTHIVPADYSGENPRWNSTEPYYDSFYCNWDTYRTLYPLFSLHDPERFALIVRGMIDIQKHEGWLPECRGATLQQWIQGGSNGDPILGEFFVKFHDHAASLGVSVDDLYTALLADAEDEPISWDLQGRQTVPWIQYNYVPDDDVANTGGTNTRQVSRTLEYAFNDFAISQVAKIIGKSDDAVKYTQRANNSFNMWNTTVSLPGFPSVVGMMQQRGIDGTFNLYTDPRHCSVNDPTHSTCFLDGNNHDGFYESSPMVYSQYVPHDTAQLIQVQGGLESFINRLDIIFNQSYFDVTDEPSQQIPFMYHYANRPGLSTQQSRRVIAESYNTSVNGLPGNDDSGAMGSFAAFYLAGLYPVPATRQLLLSSPYFPSVSFFNPLLKTTTVIKSKNWVGNPPDGNGGVVFVSDVTVNGKSYKSRCYLDWDVFTQDSIVELTLSDDIGLSCGDGFEALPPSMSTGGFD